MAGRRVALALALGTTWLLAACMSTPLPQTLPNAQNPKQTRIYVLCDADVCAGPAHPGIKIDNQSIGDLTSAGFLFSDRAPGQHVVSINLLQNYYPLTLTTRPGSVHYVHVKARPALEAYLTAGIIPQAIEQAATGHNGVYLLVEMSEPEGRALLHKLATTPNDTGVDLNPRS